VTFVINAGADGGAYPFLGTWETGGAGFSDSHAGEYSGMNNIGSVSSPVPPFFKTQRLLCAGEYNGFGFGPPVNGDTIFICFPAGMPQNFFSSINVVHIDAGPNFFTASADYFNSNWSTDVDPPVTVWAWLNTLPSPLFQNGQLTEVTFSP